jgi:hypothetical protein
MYDYVRANTVLYPTPCCMYGFIIFFFSYTLQRENQKGVGTSHLWTFYLLVISVLYAPIHLSVLIVTDLFASYICRWWQPLANLLSTSVRDDCHWSTYICFRPPLSDGCHWSIWCLSLSLWLVSLVSLLPFCLTMLIVTDLSSVYPSVSDDCHWFICCLSICRCQSMMIVTILSSSYPSATDDCHWSFVSAAYLLYVSDNCHCCLQYPSVSDDCHWSICFHLPVNNGCHWSF